MEEYKEEIKKGLKWIEQEDAEIEEEKDLLKKLRKVVAKLESTVKELNDIKEKDEGLQEESSFKEFEKKLGDMWEYDKAIDNVKLKIQEISRKRSEEQLNEHALYKSLSEKNSEIFKIGSEFQVIYSKSPHHKDNKGVFKNMGRRIKKSLLGRGSKHWNS